MFVVVAIEAEELPVATVRRVVVVVVIFVMDGKFFEFFSSEFSAAARAERWVQLERLFAVSVFPELSVAAGLGDYVLVFLRFVN